MSIPDLEGLLNGSSTISFDLKWDLNEFLAERPSAPVRSLSEILAKGLYAQSMEAQFRARDTVSARDSEARRAVLFVPLHDPEPVLEMLDRLAAPVTDLLAQVGVEEHEMELAV